MKHRCQNLEAQADALGVTNCELQTALAERGEQLQQQQNVIADLEATISAQSSDIRTALQLVGAVLQSKLCKLADKAGRLGVIFARYSLLCNLQVGSRQLCPVP